jgi:glucosamine-6-phosphate deaminase
MRITIAGNEREFDVMAAWRIIGQMLEKPDSVIGLSTGQTTINMHAIVADIFSQFPFEVSGITLFNVDELINLPRSYAGTCYARILNQIAGPLGIPEENFIMPLTISDDFSRESLLFEKRLNERGGVDLQILGLGVNGHIGINQPGTPFESETWVSPIGPDLEDRLRRETGVLADHKLGGLTRGIRNIMQSRKIILAVKGSHKAEIVARTVRGPITTDIPASILQLHPNCEVLLDAEAAKNLLI